MSDAELKARHRKMWALGDYPGMVETFLLPLGPKLVEACAIGNGMRCSTWPPRPAGADVTACDLTPELLAAGRARAQAEGLELEWVDADAENLPFEEGSFDVRACFARWACGALSSTSRSSSATACSCARPSAGCSTSRRSSIRTTTPSTSRRSTARRSPRRPTPAATAREAEFDAALNAFCDEWNLGTADRALRAGVPADGRHAGLTDAGYARPASSAAARSRLARSSVSAPGAIRQRHEPVARPGMFMRASLPRPRTSCAWIIASFAGDE